MIPGLVTHTLAEIGSRLLRLDPDSGQRLAPIAGKVILIDCVSPAVRAYFVPSADGVRVLREHDGVCDVRVQGALDAFVRVARPGTGLDPAGLDGLTIEGDLETARRFLAVFLQLDIDWEEQASQVIGDVAAHQMGNMLRALGDIGTQAVQTLLRDAGEYLQHEVRMTPPRHQVASFLDAVDVIRADVDRLEQRVRRLQETKHS